MNNIIERLWNQNKMVQIEDLKGSLFQDESAGHTFKIYGIDDAGNTVALSGTPSGIFHRPDNTDVVLSCSVSGGVVSATLPSTCYDVPGRGGITVFLTSDSQKTAIYAAVATVTRTESGTVAPPATQDVVDLINAISAAVATIPASYSDLMADIAPTYSSSSLYAVGQYAWYDGDLKRCIVPITTAESYTAAHWTNAVLGTDIYDLNNSFSSLEKKVEVPVSQSWTWEQGGYSGTAGTAVSSNKQIRTGLPTGISKIESSNGVLIRLWAYDSSNNFVGHWNGNAFSKSSSVDSFESFDFNIIPDNNYRFRVTALNSDGSDITTASAQYVYIIEITDKSLSIEGKAADAKATGDKIQTEKEILIATENEVTNTIGKTLEFIYPRFINGYYDLTAIGTTIDLTDVQESDSIYTAVIELPAGFKLMISGVVGGGSSSGGARAYAFLDEDKIVLDRASMNVTLTSTPDIPSGSKYIILNSTTLDDVNVYLTTGFFDALKENYRDNSTIIYDFGVYDEKNATINAAEKWLTGSNYKSVMIPVPRGYNKKITVAANANRETMISFLTSDQVGSNNQTVETFADGETSRHVITANTSESFITGANCNYLFVTKISSGNDYTPNSIAIELSESIDASDITELKKDVKELKTNASASGALEGLLARVISLDANGHDIPQNIGVYNAYKKAHQVIDVLWTALSAIPGSGGSTAIPAGNKKGLPYSSVKEYDKYINWNVSLKTFMTAAHNPYSLLYTEDTLGARSRSDYGITYHGYNCGAYFGIVCNILVLYAVGFKIPWNTAEFAYLNSIGVLEKVYDQSSNGVRLMDIVWQPGHTSIITDIERDQHGVPTYIYLTEAVSYFPRTLKLMPVDPEAPDNPEKSFEARIRQTGSIIYYYPELYKNLSYTPSEFVAVGDEEPQTYTYNDDICTYAGDYACFNKDDDVWINYTAGIYTTMQVYKDDELLNTVTLDTSSHKVKITTDGYGKYKARLTNGTNNSDYTYFEIIDTTVSCSYSSNILTVNFSSANGTPEYAQLTYRNGHSRGIIELTTNDIGDGRVQFKPAEVLAEQYPGETFETNVYIKVFFKGDYGVVPNAYLDTGIVS